MLVSVIPTRRPSFAAGETEALALLAAVVVQASRDAAKGDGEALTWLAEVRSARPRSLRLVDGHEAPIQGT